MIKYFITTIFLQNPQRRLQFNCWNQTKDIFKSFNNLNLLRKIISCSHEKYQSYSCNFGR